MFEKLLALVPYNPGLVHQLAFYSQRMREEASIRRTSLIFIVLAFFIQFFAVLSPPQSTVAASSNDLINGGINSRSDAISKCYNNVQNYRAILAYYGINCSDMNSAPDVTINSGGQNYYSMGRNPSPCNDTGVNVSGAGRLYWRKLTCWGGAYRTLRVQNSAGKTFYIMYDCGNLVSVGLPSPTPAPTPPPVTPPPTPTTPTPPPPPPVVYCTVAGKTNLPVNSPECFAPCEYNPLLPAGDAKCKPCDQSVGSADTTACLNIHKTATNVTAGVADANNTTANPGDVITYTLYAENKGKATVKDYVFEENMNDVSDYANVTDMHGGTMNADKIVIWPKQDIKPGETATVQITITVMNPIPQTPSSSSDPFRFDLTMTNVYGNTINIKVPGSPAKQAEIAAATLPNTGPGTTLFLASSAVIIAGYFFARARLLSKESAIAIKETVA